MMYFEAWSPNSINIFSSKAADCLQLHQKKQDTHHSSLNKRNIWITIYIVFSSSDLIGSSWVFHGDINICNYKVYSVRLRQSSSLFGSLLLGHLAFETRKLCLDSLHMSCVYTHSGTISQQRLLNSYLNLAEDTGEIQWAHLGKLPSNSNMLTTTAITPMYLSLVLHYP